MEEVTVGVFKDNVNFIVFLIMNHFFELYQEYALVKFLKNSDLGHVEALVPGGVLPFHLLDGNKLLRVIVYALDDGSVCALAQLLDKLILLH